MPALKNRQETTDRLRGMREEGRTADMPLGGHVYAGPLAAVDFSRALTAANVGTLYSETKERAKQKETTLGAPQWNKLTIFLLGGGSQEEAFLDSVRAAAQGATVALPPTTGRIVEHMWSAKTVAGSIPSDVSRWRPAS